MPPRRHRLLVSLAVVALAAPLAHAGPIIDLILGVRNDVDVNVVVDMTEEGRKLTPPTKEKPAFYYPVLAGYREEGSLVAGEKSPPPNSVAKLFAKALAAQHYYVVGTKTPAPTIILVFHWGYMNPKIDETGDIENPEKIFWNQKEMLALVAGNTLNNISALSFEREDILQAAQDDRYFALLSAYDFAAAKEKKKKLLWQAKMSTPSRPSAPNPSPSPSPRRAKSKSAPPPSSPTPTKRRLRRRKRSRAGLRPAPARFARVAPSLNRVATVRAQRPATPAPPRIP
jgi:hypothetical protein